MEYIKKPLPKNIANLGYLLTVAGLVLVLASFMSDHVRAEYNSLIIFTFLVSIGVGTLFFVALEYVAGAVWSVPFRRVGEMLAAVIFIAPVFALPVLFNMHDVFQWAAADTSSFSAEMKAKLPYLNVNFFIIRFFVMFLLWFLFYALISRNSRRQDTSYDQKLTTKNIHLSAGFMPVFAVTVTLFSVDWLMSLEPKWYSTIFGAYFFSGTFLAALAAVTFVAVTLNESGYLVKGITEDHYYSLGALMFAFTNFWAYIAFSQFMLIWYANIPEETFWIIERFKGSWAIISTAMVFIHFVIPYILLLSQPSKSDPVRLKVAALWILFAHYFDLYWLTMPSMYKGGLVFSWHEVVFPVFGIGIMLVLFNFLANKRNLVAIGDPKIERAMEFHL